MKANAKTVTVFGGSGFVGRHVVAELAKAGYQIRVAVRRPDLAFHLQPLGGVGQIRAVQANLRFPWSVKRAIEGSDTVVNLVGILSQSGNQKFTSVHVRGAKAIAENCKSSGIPLVHVSALGADTDSQSDYYASKGEGEKIVRSLLRSAIIMRPGIIFGAEDKFFNKFAAMARMLPMMPLIGGGKTRLQPVYVGDVAKAITLAVGGKLKAGQTYELAGDEVITLRQAMELAMAQGGQKRGFVHIPWVAARVMAKLTGWIYAAPITSDQVKMLQSDNVVSQKATLANSTLRGIDITPKTFASILPTYLVRFRTYGQFTKGDFSSVEKNS